MGGKGGARGQSSFRMRVSRQEALPPLPTYQMIPLLQAEVLVNKSSHGQDELCQEEAGRRPQRVAVIARWQRFWAKTYDNLTTPVTPLLQMCLVYPNAEL